MNSKIIIILLFFCALIGTNYPIAAGVTWADIFVAPLFFYTLANNWIKISNKDIIAKFSLVYAGLMLFSALSNGTIDDTVFLNYFRIYVEGCVAYASLQIALKGEKEKKFFGCMSFMYAITFLLLTSMAMSSSIGERENFNDLSSGLYGGRNGMAVTNLLLIILLTYFVFLWQNKKVTFVFVLFPFFVFNIIFSASRFSVISLFIFVLFVVIVMMNKLKRKNKIFIIAFAIVMPFTIDSIMSFMDADMMSYSSELLNKKMSNDSEAGLVFRLNELNIKVIYDWINDTPIYLWLFGDGISITHGIFSFTFCSTGIIGFLYFTITHYKMIKYYWKKARPYKYIAVLIFVFFLNDIVTNSRFTIGANTMLYMGMLAFFNRTSSMIGDNIISYRKAEK